MIRDHVPSATEMVTRLISAQQRRQPVNYVQRKPTLCACLEKKEQIKGRSPNFKARSSKLQHAVDFQESSEYQDDFDLSAVSVCAIDNQESREVFTPVVFHPDDSCKVTGKVDTSAMLSYMSLSML